MTILVDNELDRLTSITANDESTSNPVSNLIIKRLSDYYKSTASGEKTITLEFETAISIRYISFVSHNLVTGDSIMVQSFDNDAYTGTPIEFELTVRDGIIFGYKSTDYFHTSKYYKIIITKASGDYVQIGYAHMGISWFYNPHLKGSVPNYESNTTLSESIGFQAYYSMGVSRKVQEFQFIGDGVDVFDEAQELYRLFKFIPGVILPRHDAPEYEEPYFGYIESATFSDYNDTDYPFTFNIKECY